MQYDGNSFFFFEKGKQTFRKRKTWEKQRKHRRFCIYFKRASFLLEQILGNNNGNDNSNNNN